MLKEVMYRIHNAPNGRHLEITRTLQEFRKRFSSPNFVDLVGDYIRNCSAYLNIKQVQPSQLIPPLQEVSIMKSFSGELMQIDIPVPFPSSPFKYVLVAVDVFNKHLFARPLTTKSALSLATILISSIIQHSYIPQETFSMYSPNYSKSKYLIHHGITQKKLECWKRYMQD